VEGTGGLTRQELLAALRLPPEEHIIRKIARRTLTPLKVHYRYQLIQSIFILQLKGTWLQCF